MNKLKVTVNKESRQLIMEREFDANRELVWKAWTTPELLEKWWGPEHWLTTIHEMNFQPGGQWKYCMHEQGGQNMVSCGIATFKEIVAPEKMVYTDQFSDEQFTIAENMPTLEITNIFEDQGEKTKLVSSSTFASVEELEKVVAMGVEEGFSQQLERLDELFINLKSES